MNLIDSIYLIRDELRAVDKMGKPINEHCVRVMLIASRYGVEDLHAAILHDLVEDSTITFDDLRNLGYSEETVARIDMLTHREGESYPDYIRRIGTSGDFDTILIKLADNEDNTTPDRMTCLPQADQEYLQQRYDGAREYLLLRARDLSTDAWRTKRDVLFAPLEGR